MQNDVHGFHHSRKAIQLRTHLSNEAPYWQHSDHNGTAPTISRHKTRPETLLQRTSNAYIKKNSQQRQSDPQSKRTNAKKSRRHQHHNLQVIYPIHHPLCFHPVNIIDPTNSQQSPNNPEQHRKNHQTFFTKNQHSRNPRHPQARTDRNKIKENSQKMRQLKTQSPAPHKRMRSLYEISIWVGSLSICCFLNYLWLNIKFICCLKLTLT